MPNDCDNCAVRINEESDYHYLGESPRDFPNASKGDPAVLCGICFRLFRGHRGPALAERAERGGWSV